MFACAVAAVDDGDARAARQFCRAAFFRVTDHGDVSIALDHLAGVEQRFALGRRTGCLGFGHADDAAAQPQHRAFERQARARGRLVKQRRQDFAVEQSQPLARRHRRLELARLIQHRADFIARQICDGDHDHVP